MSYSEREPRSKSKSKSRSRSRSSEYSAGGGRRENELALHIFSQGHGHWGTMISPQDGERGVLYHVRTDPRRQDDTFVYERAEKRRQTPLLFGRTVLGKLSESERRRADAVLDEYGRDEFNIPVYSRGEDCQTWTTGAYDRLEAAGLLAPGNAEYFRRKRGYTGRAMEEVLEQDGRDWQRSGPQRRPGGRRPMLEPPADYQVRVAEPRDGSRSGESSRRPGDRRS